jgi:hypothetical protein
MYNYIHAGTSCLCKEINFHCAFYRVRNSLNKNLTRVAFNMFCHGLSWHSGQPNVLSMSCTNFSIYLICLFREQDQWIQCDDCSKWRRLPLNVIVASKWTCADNTWDPKRYDYFTPVIESINFYMPKDRSGIYDNPYAVQ